MNHNYKTIAYYSKEDKSYIIFAPDLPGCFSDGKTIDEAKENIAVIIEEWKELAQDLGKDIPKPLKEVDYTKASAWDVAKYILSRTGPISTFMLQKLVYYCDAWSLGWFHTPLFEQEIQAWAKGPVVYELFNMHRGRYVVSDKEINSNHKLSDSEKRLIDNVLTVYANEDPEWLVDLTHSEEPWIAARGDLPENDSSNNIIQKSAIEKYYSNLSAC